MEPCGTLLCIEMVLYSSPPSCTLETRPVRYALIHNTMKFVVNGIKIKVNDINCEAFVHHACHRFLEDKHIGVGNNADKATLPRNH